jgi:DNA-directed RNA polymerase specialized sigma24 family protein
LTSRAAEDLRSIIERLPDSYRHIILADACARDRVASARFLAEELEIPEGTIRVYRKRAMSALRSEMRKLGYEVP